MDTMVNDIADFKYEVKFNLWGYWGRLEDNMALEATKMAVRSNMHMETRVNEITEFKSEVKFDLWGYWGRLEVIMSSNAK